MRVEDAEFPKGLSEDVVVTKNQKGGKRSVSENVSVAMVDGNLYIKRYVKGSARRNVSIRIPNAKQYGANEIIYRLELGVGTSTDALRLMGDAILELYKKEGLRFEKSVGASDVSPEESVLRDALVEKLRKSGMEVVTDSKEAQRVLEDENAGMRLSAKQKRALETASVSQKEKHQQTVISSANGTKILKNLDKLARKYENDSYTKEKSFIGNLAKALEIDSKKSSQYATFETQNGKVLTIRLSNHNATVSNFDKVGETEGISIVVTPKDNEGITNDGNAHIVEFFYDSIKLRKADGKPLAEIVRSIQQSLYSGEYKDNTGLAQRQEVNASYRQLREHRVLTADNGELSNLPEKQWIEVRTRDFKNWFGDWQESDDASQVTDENGEPLIVYHGTDDNFSTFDRSFLGKNTDLNASEEAFARTAHVGFWFSTRQIPNADKHMPVYLNFRNPLRFDSLEDMAITIGEADSVEAYLNEIKSEGYDSIIIETDEEYGGTSYVALDPNQIKSATENVGTFDRTNNDIRFFRTKSGEAYGFTVDGKIYLDRKVATAETPIHEYAHLWADALRRINPQEWDNVVELMKGTPVWEEVKRMYPELKTDDAIADEVLAHYSGRRGAERLREEQRRIAKGDGSIIDKANAIAAIQNVRDALAKFWKGVADWLGIHFTTAEEVADKVMADLLNGVNPVKHAKVNGNPRFHFIGERGAENLDKAEEATTRLDNLAVAREMEDAFNEKKKRIEKLRTSEPVEITGKEYEGKYELDRDSAQKYILENLRDEYTIVDTGELVKVTKKGAKKVTSHSMGNETHLKSIAAIPEIIKKAVFIEETPAYKTDAQYDSYRYYVTGLNVAGEDYTVRMTIGVKNGEFYYDHYLTEIEKGNLIEAARSFKPTEDAPNPSYAAIKDTKLLSLLQMDEQENSRRIKLATGWERGADGKWRYEVMDGEFDRNGELHPERRKLSEEEEKELDDAFLELNDAFTKGQQVYDEENIEIDENLNMADIYVAGGMERKKAERLAYLEDKQDKLENLPKHLDDYISNEALFSAYPELRNVKVEEGDSMGALVGRLGHYDPTTNTILLNDLSRDVLLHEMQHVIQRIEGFARGGNKSTYRNHLAGLKEKHDAWSVIEEFEDKRKELGDDVRPIDVYNALVEEYQSLGVEFGDGIAPSREAFDKGFNLWVRGYDNEGYEDAYNEYQRLAGKFGLGGGNNRYNQLAGEVEARNVQKRMDMTEEERRKTLAAETEDVAREDQLFIMENTGQALGTDATSVEGVKKDKGLRFREDDLEEVNERFNEQLDSLTEENAQGVILDLGRPGDILLSAGLSDREIRLYGNKVMKKIRKHGFDISSIRNLPITINNPIAVFNNYGNVANRAILTELKPNRGMFWPLLNGEKEQTQNST